MPSRVLVMFGRAALVAGLVLASMLAGGVALAGGPTSALLASPQSDSATALYHTDAEYGRLLTLLGGDSPAATASEPTPAVGGPTYVTVTWLIHDVVIWRIDRIFLDAPGGPWAVTQSARPDEGQAIAEGLFPGGSGVAGAVWHRPTDATALRSLLDGLDLTGEPAQVGDAPVPGAPPPLGNTGPQLVDPIVSGWGWALVGLVVGATAAVLGRRAATGLRRGTNGTLVA